MTSHLNKNEKISMKTLKLDFINAKSYIIGLPPHVVPLELTITFPRRTHSPAAIV
jgi:hypothetical protein